MDTNKKKGLPWYVKFLVFLLIILAIIYGRKKLIASRHPYKDMEVIGTWDYGYSVTFDADEHMVRTDKDLFSLEMFAETEIVLEDDGVFRITIEGVDITGSWEPDEKYSNVFHLSPDDPDTSGILVDNEIRWDKEEDRLCIGLTKETAPESLSKLFREDEEYRYIFCKTYRDGTKVVYRDTSDDNEEDEWDDGDDGLPYRYDP